MFHRDSLLCTVILFPIRGRGPLLFFSFKWRERERETKGGLGGGGGDTMFRSDKELCEIDARETPRALPG